MKLRYLAAALLGAAFSLGQAQAAIKVQTVAYKQGGAALAGWLVYDDALQGKRPGVVVYPEWYGPSAFEKQIAERLARMGYVAFVADIYGKDVRPETPQAAGAEMMKYVKNQKLLLARAQAGFDQLRRAGMVDASKLAAIGFCFGGAPALDLAQSGAPLVDIVTFHGAFGAPDIGSVKNIKGHVLILHGAADPVVPMQAVNAFEKKMTAANVDWQVDLYGGVMHAFTDNVHPSDPAHGTQYNAAAAASSWQAMSYLFKTTM